MSTRMYGLAPAIAAVAMMTAGCDRGETVADPATTTTTTTEARTDEQLETYVQARYQAEPSVAASDIDVTADNGVVTLRGTVSSDAARQQAAALARQSEGVREVDNQLQVEPATNPGRIIANAQPIEPGANASGGDPRASGQANGRTPAWITTKILSQYFLDTEVKPWNVDVTTRRDGTVVLRGEVDDAQSREAAERIARTTEGVTSVDNQLRLQSEPQTTAANANRDTSGDRADATTGIDEPDPWLTAKIQAKFFMDDDVKGLDIDVDTQNGVVTLSGEVESAAERRQAIALARNTEGVRSVTDQLKVVTTDAVQARSGDTGDTAANTGANAPAPNAQPFEDGWITTKIQSKFFLDGDIKGRDVNVNTENGVVTLTGEVATQAERQTAESIAGETQGVTRVVNQLSLTARNPQ